MRWRSLQGIHCLRSNSFQSSLSEFDPCLEGDHTRRAVTAEADAQQSRWRRDGAGDGSESCLRSRLSGNAGLIIRRQREVWVVEDIEDLRIETEGHMLA